MFNKTKAFDLLNKGVIFFGFLPIKKPRQLGLTGFFLLEIIMIYLYNLNIFLYNLFEGNIFKFLPKRYDNN